MTDLAAELARCDAEIERAAKGECIGAAIGWADWSVERRLILEEMRMRGKEMYLIAMFVEDDESNPVRMLDEAWESIPHVCKFIRQFARRGVTFRVMTPHGVVLPDGDGPETIKRLKAIGKSKPPEVQG